MFPSDIILKFKNIVKFNQNKLLKLKNMLYISFLVDFKLYHYNWVRINRINKYSNEINSFLMKFSRFNNIKSFLNWAGLGKGF